MISYFTTTGDQHGWAIDEDLRLTQEALAGVAKRTPLASAQVIHSPFWAGLAMHAPGVLARRFVIAHADNPPFFYLTQPDFAAVQIQVDLWVARSLEAYDQFQRLRMPVVHIPYAIDERLFFPIADRKALRTSWNLPSDAYLIGNFHRDSEGGDLGTPKLQKAPELLVQICGRLREQGAPIHVLLAGPRRHWIRKALSELEIPFTYVGSECDEDDFGINILPRNELNRLYNACDLYVIPSRWEGGPQSAMEAVAAKTKVLSIPLGVGRDILEPESLFFTVPEAVRTILRDIQEDILAQTIEPQFLRWESAHTSGKMQANLRNLYADLTENPDFRSKVRTSCPDFVQEAIYQIRRRLRTANPHKAVRLCGEFAGEGVPDVPRILRTCGTTISSEASLCMAGKVADPNNYAGQVQYQFLSSGLAPAEVIPGACVIFPSVQEAVNLRESGLPNPVLVCPPEISQLETGDGPLVIEANDNQASMNIWHAMAAGRPIVYPEGSAYYYQVFHGGVPHGGRHSQEDAVRIAREELEGLRTLARVPGMPHPFLKRLLDVKIN